MNGIQLQCVDNPNDHKFRTRSKSTPVEHIGICSEEWVITPLATGIETDPSGVCQLQGIGPASQTLDSTSILQDF